MKVCGNFQKHSVPFFFFFCFFPFPFSVVCVVSYALSYASLEDLVSK